MLLELSGEQDVLVETTARFLAESVPTGRIREQRDDPIGFDAGYWRQGAELGWTSLLVDEAHGGGSVSGLGLVDLTLIAHQFGRHAAPGPLTPTNVVAALINAADWMDHDGVLDGLLSGEQTAAWALAEPVPGDRLGSLSAEIRVAGDEVVLNGTKRPVEGAVGAGAILVSGRSAEGVTNVVVPAGTEGVRIRPLISVDLARRFAVVELDEVRVPVSAIVGEIGGAREQVEWATLLAVVLSCADAVGAMQAAFEMTVEWGFDRYSFGRPLASYQALKHRYADMKSWLEASHAITDRAAEAVAGGAPDGAELASAAKAYVGDYGGELVQDCIQLHGGIGVTYEHDLHLYARRVVANRTLYGTPGEHRRRLADIVEQREKGR
jgi:alkylation response protein AidB-like acyl-CoA dehydrogenase